MVSVPSADIPKEGGRGRNKPRLITLLSTHQSPTTVNKNANVFTIGTVKLSSVQHQPPPPPQSHHRKEENSPAFPINKKNHTLPVKFTTSGTAYLGFRSRSATPSAAP